MKKIISILVLLFAIWACDSVSDGVVEIGFADYVVKDVNAPSEFKYTSVDSTLEHSISFQNAGTIEKVSVSLRTFKGQVIVSSIMELEAGSDSENKTFTGGLILSKEYSSGNYELVYNVTDNVNATGQNVNNAAVHQLVYDNNQDNKAPVISDILVYYTNDPNKTHLDTIVVNKNVLFTIKVTDPNGSDDIEEVRFDMEWNGEYVGFRLLNDEGKEGDEVAGDGIYSRTQSFKSGSANSNFIFTYSATDKDDAVSNKIIHNFIVK